MRDHGTHPLDLGTERGQCFIQTNWLDVSLCPISCMDRCTT
jgi:hypothetical protein